MQSMAACTEYNQLQCVCPQTAVQLAGLLLLMRITTQLHKYLPIFCKRQCLCHT